MPINRNTSILRKFSNATRISFMKNLNFISINSTTHFTIIYLYYIYVIICFLGFLLNLSDIRLRIKPLFCTKPLFSETFKKSSMPCRFVRRVLTSTVLFFVFPLKKSSRSVLSLRIPMCRKTTNKTTSSTSGRARNIFGQLNSNLSNNFSISHTFRQIVWIKWLFC